MTNLQSGEAIYLLGLVTYLATRTLFQRRHRSAGTRERRSSTLDSALIGLVVLGQAAIPACYIFSPWLNFANYHLSSVLLPFGAATLVAALWLFWQSHHDLGSNWSVTLELRSTHQLITNGVYSRVRHPMYSSFLLMAWGQALLLSNWLAGWAALVAVLLLCVVRIPREESMMLEFFGEEYRQYMARTGGVTPRFARRGVA